MFLRNVGAYIQIHSVTAQKENIGNFTALRTSDLTNERVFVEGNENLTTLLIAGCLFSVGVCTRGLEWCYDGE
jgi:hypothetical protein